jgi:hypothetical protein
LAARVLGARHLAQSAALTARPAALTGPAALTESLHVASMLGLAVIAPKYRAPALASALVATVLGVGALASWRAWRSAG